MLRALTVAATLALFLSSSHASGQDRPGAALPKPEQPPPAAAPGGSPDGALLLMPGDGEEGALLTSVDQPLFVIPPRFAYRNAFDQATPIDDVEYFPGESDLVVDVTTRLGTELPIVMISFAVLNRNPARILFDATMTIYPDAGGAPDLANPIASIPAASLYAPANTAIGVARLYLNSPSPFMLPPGRVWFGVEISNIRGGDPQLFGQIATDNVTAGSSTGTLVDAAGDPPTVLAIPPRSANLDRVIIPHVECAADWDLNALVDVRDVASFINEYAGNPREADYNGDSHTNIFDFGDFASDYMFCIGQP